MNRRNDEGAIRKSDLLQRLWRRLRALGVHTRYRLGLREPGPGKVELSESFHHPIDSDQRQLLVAQYRTLFPDKVQTELAEARRLLQHQFTLLGHTMIHDDRIAWLRDPVSGLDWEHGFSPSITYRGPRRLGDIKLPWELNKHQYFFTLGKAAWLTDDPQPAVEIVRQIDAWIEDNPYHRGINWISALEVGTRAISWIMAYPFYSDHNGAPFRHRLSISLAQHMFFVERHLSTGRYTNTHLIGEAMALVIGGLFLKCRHSLRWTKKGLALLEEEMKRQVTLDGVHRERSIAYHRFFLDHYYLVHAFLTVNDCSLSAVTLRGMERMTDILMDVLWPDGSAPAFGDCDDARGLWLRADSPTDYRSLLALGAALFGRGDFKAVAGGLTEEVLWLMGIPGVSKFQLLQSQVPDHTSIAYSDGGYFVMRGGWDETNPMLVFDCGPLGDGPASHGHADALSFQFFSGEYPFFVDSGTFSYNLDYQWRDAFRSTRAHNTVIVDGLDQSVPGDRMSWRSMAVTRCHKWLSNCWLDLADGEHDGYGRLARPVAHRRVVAFLKPDLWWIWDYFTGDSHHDLELLLHLKPDCTIEVGEGGTGLVLRSPKGIGINVWMPSEEDERGYLEVIEGGDRKGMPCFSPGYATKLPTRALRAKREFVGQCSIFTCFSTSNQVTATLVQKDGTIRLEVRRGVQSEETLLYRVKNDKPIKTKDIYFDGQVFYCRKVVGSPAILWAEGFRELFVADLLKVRSPVFVQSLVLEDVNCKVVLPSENASSLQFEVRDGIQLMINGQRDLSR